MKVYITQANFNKLIKDKELEKGNNELYKYKGKILRFLPFGYLKFLNKYSNFLSEFSNGRIPSFNNIEIQKDTYTKIYEGGKPAYHLFNNCSKLHSDYINYDIPLVLLKRLKEEVNLWFDNNKKLISEDISNFKKALLDSYNITFTDKELIEYGGNLGEKILDILWKQKVKDFRNWFLNNKNILDSNEDKFFKLMNEKWGVRKFDNSYEFSNSGFEEFENYTGDELEKEIEKRMKLRMEYYNGLNKQEKNILQFLGKSVFIFNNIKEKGDDDIFWDKVKEFHKNYRGYKPNLDTLFDGYSYENIIFLLRNYENNYMLPIKKLLIYYINIKINPNFNFESSLLEELGFNVCYECDKRKNTSN